MSYSCSDNTGGSGLSAGACPGDDTVSGEGADQSRSGTVTDEAGNSASVTKGDINIDKTAPTAIAFVGGSSLNDGASYDFNSVPAGPTGCTADGAISGLDGCTVGGYSTAVGPQTVTATAKDKAGNTSTKTLSYTVKAATANGFYPLQRPGCHGGGHRTGGKDALQGAKPSDLKATRASGRAVVY